MNTWQKGCTGLALLLAAASVSAEIYHYTDDNGRKIYVDRQSQIPAQYREQVQIRKEESQTLNRVERERRQKVLDQLQEKKGAKGEIAGIEAEMGKLEQKASVNGNSVRVPVEIRYLARTVTANLIVDTGASRTILHSNIARRMGVTPKPNGRARIVGGASLPLGMIETDSLSIGPVVKEGLELAVITPSESLDYDGLLGMDVLGSVKYEIDMERGLVIWNADRYRELERKKEALLSQGD